MSRNMIEANSAIFRLLDDYCKLKEGALANAGKARWIASSRDHRRFMIHAKVGDHLTFSQSRKLARLELSNKSYLFTIGFEVAGSKLGVSELELDAAFLTVALSDFLPPPKATIIEIKNVVEWSDKESDPSYGGHDYEGISSLFPKVRVFDITGRAHDETWNVFFQSCIDECEVGASWIESGLAETLRALCALDGGRVPYRVLCRSIFDGDKSSFFLAQYRCLEALYGYSSAHALAKRLSIPAAWFDIAAALENDLGWHPREESSLETILRFASPLDLKTIIFELGYPLPDQFEILVTRASKAIYKLRNSLVHYRPAQHSVDIHKFN